MVFVANRRLFRMVNDWVVCGWLVYDKDVYPRRVMFGRRRLMDCRVRKEVVMC